MKPEPQFKPGDKVLLSSTNEMGTVECCSLDGGAYWYRTRFAKRLESLPEADLQALVDADETLISLANKGQWGNIRAFRAALAVERINNTNQNTVYAFRAQRILFEPFQYKPLLKILNSIDRRILIADEVGLGKTIETGLILAELEARQHLDRVLIICPSRLREKWRIEMCRKFGREFGIFARKDLENYFTQIRRNPKRNRLRAIVSMQTMRNEDLREHLLAEVGSIDLLVVDEAHHARNPSAMISAMVRELCEIAGAALLLTATPLHLGNRDLFTLLQALRPSGFREFEVFEKRLDQFKGIHKAALLVRSDKKEDLEQARAILQKIFETNVSPAMRDHLAIQVIKDMGPALQPDRKVSIDLERRIQDLHPLASIVTRTRKRDVREKAAIRVARVFRCQWTPEEDNAYRKLVLGSKKLGWIDQPMTLGQIQRARQAASCLPAALQADWALAQINAEDDNAVELSDLMPSELLRAGINLKKSQQPPPPTLDGADSKFEKLLELLDLVQKEETNAKILIFTFFVGTSKYLEKQLTAKGYRTLRIAGDVLSDPKRPEKDERGKLMRRFQEDSDVRILVSTEVGSEGLDFQFCHYLVNYDLPWNPMVVEQRIGRIDRFGQTSDRVHILNLIVEDTVEDRILFRLYDRIGIFEKSIGQLEAILGEQISELQKDYVSGKLTPEEAERRVNDDARAIQVRSADLEKLENNAANLFGHEEYLKDQLRRVDHLGRYISEKSMLAVIEAFLHTNHPSVRIWEEPPGIYRLNVSESLRQDILRAVPSGEDVRIGGAKQTFVFTFDGGKAYNCPDVELINVSHPMLKAAISSVSQQLRPAFARTAKGALVLRPGTDEELPAGNYFILVFANTLAGIRARKMLETIVWSTKQEKVLPSETGERILHLVLQQGVEWDSRQQAPVLHVDVWNHVKSAAEGRRDQLHEAERQENESLYISRKGLLEAEFQYTQKIKQTRLETAQARGSTRIIPALRGQMEKAEAIFRERLADLERMRDSSCHLSEPLAVCVVNVVRPSP